MNNTIPRHKNNIKRTYKTWNFAMQLILANITLVTTSTCLISDWTKSGQKLDLFPRKKLGMIKRVSWSHEEWVQKIIRALIDNKYQNKNGGFMRAHNFCHINVKLLDESEMAPVLSSNEHNRPKVYTQHLRCISSLSESGNDRDQNRTQNKNVTWRVQKVECQKETPTGLTRNSCHIGPHITTKNYM